MKILKSDKFKIPKVFFISDRSKIKEIPIGVPFIVADKAIEEQIVRILEYEVLYQEATRSGYPFNFKKILIDNGYTDLIDWYYDKPVYMDFSSASYIGDEEDEYEADYSDLVDILESPKLFKDFIRDSSVVVDIEKLKDLNVFPIWLDVIEKAINTNVHNYAVFNSNMYNKKLDGMYGAAELVSPPKNLLVVDISGSIPKGVSSTLLAMSKNIASSFFADLLITGSRSTLYPYEEIQGLDIESMYEYNGMGNDQITFKNLVTGERRIYGTAIVFGDNHSPCYAWSNEYNRGSRSITRKAGKELCTWEVSRIISFHTDNDNTLAGYADWFTCDEVTNINDWVKYLNE